MHYVIVGSVGGGVTTQHIATPQGMTYEAARKLADEINAMYAAQQSVQPTPPTEPQNFCNPVNGVHASWCTGHKSAGG